MKMAEFLFLKGYPFTFEIKVMISILQVLEEFYNIFGPELKAVTGDPKRIEEVLVRVDALVTPLEEVHNMQTGNPICTNFVWFQYGISPLE